MAIFQTSVLKKYLKQQDHAVVDKAYKKYSKYFHNPAIQENIRSSKEEQFQEGFLRELFVNVLDYTLNPQPKFNLTTELKNEKGSKKADGAILKEEKAIAVIELKGTNTKDLESIRQQAFDYKANHKSCVYVVTSNFEKLRFYINNAVDFEEFNLFALSPQRFALLYLCLYKDNILADLPQRIKNDSVVAEEDITKKFYADYSIFKRELFRDLVKLNMKNEVFRAELTREDADRGQKNIKLTLFKKSQKLIDRFLFIFFAEDRGLLPPNSITLIINEYNQLKELDRAEPLYDTYKLYFKYLDQGRVGTAKKAEIFAYNGGLFKPDAVLNSLLISDDLLLRHTSKLTKYDFESQVDVNILGHIFENSLNEIESVNAEIEGTDFDKQKTKRKKDGVFYTPKYITKYIVDNTVGKLCEEKKAELKLEEEEYHKGRKNRQKKTLEDLLAKLETYREWLLSLTICDPACGSGAFLNQALDFLIREHTYVDELKTALLGGALVLSDIENTILERNIYGVDLNEESVEIAKLSLWLRTAQPRRKLNSLNNNIKCGNSLIDSKTVAGDKAFTWEEEFPEVFEAGGFDVVIGNPPYVGLRSDESYYSERYFTFSCKDLYAYFYEKSSDITNENGIISLITPSSFLTNIGFQTLRKFLYDKNIKTIIDLGANVFSDAAVDSAIITFSNEGTQKAIIVSDNLSIFRSIDKSIFKELDGLNFDINVDIKHLRLCKKIEVENLNLEEFVNFSRGVEFGFKSDFVVDEKLDNTYLKLLCGGNISKNQILFENKYLKFDEDNTSIYKNIEIYTQPKILIKRIGSSIIAAFDDLGYCNVCDVYNLQTKIEETYWLTTINSILNSKLISFYFNTRFRSVKKLFPKIPIQNLKVLPIPNFNIVKVEGLRRLSVLFIDRNKALTSIVSSFLTYLQSQFGVQKWSKKMEKWYELEFGEFIKELNKAAKKAAKEQGTDHTAMTKTQEFEYMELFTTKKAEAQALKAEIDKTDREIDAMVYELYGLTEEEIAIVEGS